MRLGKQDHGPLLRNQVEQFYFWDKGRMSLYPITTVTEAYLCSLQEALSNFEVGRERERVGEICLYIRSYAYQSVTITLVESLFFHAYITKSQGLQTRYLTPPELGLGET